MFCAPGMGADPAVRIPNKLLTGNYTYSEKFDTKTKMKRTG